MSTLLQVLGVILLGAQGIVPLIMKLAGSDQRSWQAALYLPEGLQIVGCVAFVVLGLALCAAGESMKKRAR